MAREPSDDLPAPQRRIERRIEWRSRRVPALAAAALLHVALVGLILWSQPDTIPIPVAPREVFFLFRPPPNLATRLPRKIEPRLAVAHAPPAPLFHYAPSTAITLPPQVTTPLELSLFHCSPENLARLTPEERLHCGGQYTEQAFAAPIPGTLDERSQDAERWQAALVARNTPAAAPCASVERFEVRMVTQQTANAVMVDPLCVLGQIRDQAER